MASGGIFDQAGGGFCRYSTDEYWHVPHFEKMLYDNAQLVSLYSKAYMLGNMVLLKRTIVPPFSLSRGNSLARWSFYASLDADSEGTEGKYYTWTSSEIKAIVGDDSGIFHGSFWYRT